MTETKAYLDGISSAGEGELDRRLEALAESIVADIAGQDPDRCQELLSAFVSHLFLSATKQSLRQERRKKQAEGIAAAKARGVRFGAQAKPLPENFLEVCQSWQDRKLTLKEAAKACGMPQSTFYDAARRTLQTIQIIEKS